MKYIEQKYTSLKEVVAFKKDLNWQKKRYAILNIKLIPSYNTQAYELMNKAAAIISKLDDYLSSDSNGKFTDEEFNLIDKLKTYCHHSVTKKEREDSFIILEESVNHRMEYF
jgi:hypothetical protein